ncbi:MAG: hypothetical protein KIT84_14630 [Labilithrix sp.]|nr:hypothetical protein [Labilithrix sp.]MCW5812257.1 hypothetical protein [Labilithrix sp.]
MKSDVTELRRELPDGLLDAKIELDVDQDLVDRPAPKPNVLVVQRRVSESLAGFADERHLPLPELDPASAVERSALDFALHDDELPTRVALGHELVTEDEPLFQTVRHHTSSHRRRNLTRTATVSRTRRDVVCELAGRQVAHV